MSDTLFLAISYIDRFLSLHVVPRQQLQLVGVSCMLLAAKYEEIYAPQACSPLLLVFPFTRIANMNLPWCPSMLHQQKASSPSVAAWGLQVSCDMCRCDGDACEAWTACLLMLTWTHACMHMSGTVTLRSCMMLLHHKQDDYEAVLATCLNDHEWC